jgi:hypothetical protein
LGAAFRFEKIFFWILKALSQQFFICRLSDITVPDDVKIEPWTEATLAFAVG